MRPIWLHGPAMGYQGPGMRACMGSCRAMGWAMPMGSVAPLDGLQELVGLGPEGTAARQATAARGVLPTRAGGLHLVKDRAEAGRGGLGTGVPDVLS